MPWVRSSLVVLSFRMARSLHVALSVHMAALQGYGTLWQSGYHGCAQVEWFPRTLWLAPVLWLSRISWLRSLNMVLSFRMARSILVVLFSYSGSLTSHVLRVRSLAMVLSSGMATLTSHGSRKCWLRSLALAPFLDMAPLVSYGALALASRGSLRLDGTLTRYG